MEPTLDESAMASKNLGALIELVSQSDVIENLPLTLGKEKVSKWDQTLRNKSYYVPGLVYDVESMFKYLGHHAFER